MLQYHNPKISSTNAVERISRGHLITSSSSSSSRSSAYASPAAAGNISDTAVALLSCRDCCCGHTQHMPPMLRENCRCNVFIIILLMSYYCRGGSFYAIFVVVFTMWRWPPEGNQRRVSVFMLLINLGLDYLSLTSVIGE